MSDASSKTCFCPVRCCSMQPGAYAVTNAISATTTKEEFEAVRKKYPQFQMHFGGRCGWNAVGTAASKGNFNLLDYLLSTYGGMLANVGNEFGWTALLCTVFQRDLPEDVVLRCVETLLSFGADPYIEGQYPGGNGGTTTTPLAFCKEENIYPSVVALLEEK